MVRQRRKSKLPRPALQLKLVFTFLGLCALGLLFQCLLFATQLTDTAAKLPTDGAALIQNGPAMMRKVLLLSSVAVLTLAFIAGVLVTFRIAGPIYRMEVFLRQILRGEKPADCRLRKGDALQDFCRLLNQATAPLREPGARTATGSAEARGDFGEAA